MCASLLLLLPTTNNRQRSLSMMITIANFTVTHTVSHLVSGIRGKFGDWQKEIAARPARRLNSGDKTAGQCRHVETSIRDASM